MEASFDSRVYIVTGGAAGIGFSICKLLLEYGAIVYAVDIVPETTAELHSLFKDRFTYLQADIKDVAASQSIVQDIIKKHKRLDGLVNNAAVCLQEGELPEHEMYDSTFDVNVRGAWNFARDTLAQMKEQGSGSIVNVGSLASVDGEARLPLYTASKHALAGFTKTWALDFAKYGVRVNMVAPGPTDTSMVRRTLKKVMGPVFGLEKTEDELLEYVKVKIPMGRLGQPREIANAVAFFLSDFSSFTTGQVLVVDGAFGM